MASGNAEDNNGAYKGPRTIANTASRVRVSFSTAPVSGCITLAWRGKDASSARQSAANAGHRCEQATSALQAASTKSSAAWLSLDMAKGSTMSGGATPSNTARRTAAGNCRMYSSAARVP